MTKRLRALPLSYCPRIFQVEQVGLEPTTSISSRCSSAGIRRLIRLSTMEAGSALWHSLRTSVNGTHVTGIEPASPGLPAGRITSMLCLPIRGDKNDERLHRVFDASTFRCHGRVAVTDSNRKHHVLPSAFASGSLFNCHIGDKMDEIGRSPVARHLPAGLSTCGIP